MSNNHCSWCGHVWPHPHPCPRTISTTPKTTVPCPCGRAQKETR